MTPQPGAERHHHHADLRPVADADTDALVALVNHAYRGEPAPWWSTERHLVAGPRLTPASLRALRDRPDSVVLVADAPPPGPGAPAPLLGCVHLQREDAPKGPARCHLGMLTVRTEAQGSGAGRAILAAAEAHARRRWGCERMVMEVLEQRTDLRAWYARRGYHPTGETQPFLPRPGITFLQGPLTFVVLEKRIGPEEG